MKNRLYLVILLLNSGTFVLSDEVPPALVRRGETSGHGRHHDLSLRKRRLIQMEDAPATKSQERQSIDELLASFHVLQEEAGSLVVETMALTTVPTENIVPTPLPTLTISETQEPSRPSVLLCEAEASINFLAPDESEFEWKEKGQVLFGDYDGDDYGRAVSMSADGNIVAIGAGRHDKPGRDSFGNPNTIPAIGRVRVFVYQAQNETWTQFGQDIEGLEPYDFLGWTSVALSSDGLTLAPGSEKESGYIYRYSESDNLWLPKGQKLGDNWGKQTALSADGNTVATGHDNRAFVYRYNNATNRWIQLGSPKSLSGRSTPSRTSEPYPVALSSDGSILAVGNAFASKERRGCVFLFRYNETIDEWNALLPQCIEGLQDERFGRSVALSSDGSIVAAGGTNEENGVLRVFRCNNVATDGPSYCEQMGQTLRSTVVSILGRSGSIGLSSSGQILVAGAAAYFRGGFMAHCEDEPGHAHVLVFNETSNLWERRGQELEGGRRWDNFGRSVSLSADGSFLVAGNSDAIRSRFASHGLGLVKIFQGGYG